DDAAEETRAAAGDRGDEVADEAAGAGFGEADREVSFLEAISKMLRERDPPLHDQGVAEELGGAIAGGDSPSSRELRRLAGRRLALDFYLNLVGTGAVAERHGKVSRDA